MGLTLKTDNYGYARFLEREAATMEPHQLDRELVHNGAEAGATTVCIDGHVDPETGHLLKRFTDNGTGMTPAQLKSHMSTMHLTGKNASKNAGKNFGIGARIAGLPKNPAGMTFASRSTDGDWQTVLWKSGGVYEMAEWEPSENSGPGPLYVAHADQGQLGRLDELAPSDTGTAVILAGTGTKDTWSDAEAYAVAKWLTQRYFQFPNDTAVKVIGATASASHTATGTVVPFGTRLHQHSTASGIVTVELPGATAYVSWWLLADTAPNGWFGYKDKATGGVGVLVDGEIFNYATTYSLDFGVWLASVAKRCALLIEIDGASMNSARSGVVLPGGGTAVPWKAIGAKFAEQMPDELLAEMEAAKGEAFNTYTEDWANSLDPEWFKKVAKTPSIVADDDGDETVDTTAGPDGGVDTDTDEPTTTKVKKHSADPAKRKDPSTPDGDLPATKKPRSNLPQILFFPAAEMTDGAYVEYSEGTNIVKVSKDSPSYVRTVEETVKGHKVPVDFAVDAVETAWRKELAAHIIHANAHSKVVPAQLIEEMKTPMALYAKTLGFMAIDTFITDHIKSMKKLQSDAFTV